MSCTNLSFVSFITAVSLKLFSTLVCTCLRTVYFPHLGATVSWSLWLWLGSTYFGKLWSLELVLFDWKLKWESNFDLLIENLELYCYSKVCHIFGLIKGKVLVKVLVLWERKNTGFSILEIPAIYWLLCFAFNASIFFSRLPTHFPCYVGSLLPYIPTWITLLGFPSF